VTVAAFGVLIFVISFTEFSPDSPIFSISNESTETQGVIERQVLPSISGVQLFFTFRASAQLLFIEALAWFLLRQHRALIEDYKAFYRYYMRRANYLAALKIAIENPDKDLMTSVVNTLLSEDLTQLNRLGRKSE